MALFSADIWAGYNSVVDWLIFSIVMEVNLPNCMNIFAGMVLKTTGQWQPVLPTYLILWLSLAYMEK
eukprot:2830965-Ditylum_brightwellii.AAC.1